MTNDATRATATALPADPLAPRGSLTCSIDMKALRKLDMKGLHDLRDVIHTMAEVLGGILCQPRFSMDDENRYNGAGELLENILEFLNGYEQAAVNVATAAEPSASRDVEWRHWTILGFEADMSDDLAEFAVHAAQAVRDEATAQFRERHPRRE